MTGISPLSCRLCGGEIRRKFALRVLNRHDVSYFACQSCHSLQTEKPYWLDEAYATRLAFLDTGAVQRNLTNVAAVRIASSLLGARNIRDFGGGDGMLCRLLRDYGLNCFVEDKYAEPVYAAKFVTPDFENADLVLAFEVIEHFQDPVAELGVLFAGNPGAVMASTLVYEGQGEDWWYLTPETGQHVFFYSADALRLIGSKFGYDVLLSGGFSLFLRRGTVARLRQTILRAALAKVPVRLARAGLAFLPPVGAKRDFDTLRHLR